MPWKECGAMEERMRFIVDWERLGLPFQELCERYGISRPTGYKWVERFVEEGATGLAERSRRPRHSPQATAQDIVAGIVEARRRHPTWGGKKIARLCEDRMPDRTLPHPSTVDDIFTAQRVNEDAHPAKAAGTSWTADHPAEGPE